MSVQNVIAICQIVVETLQSGSKYWIDWTTNTAIPRAMQLWAILSALPQILAAQPTYLSASYIWSLRSVCSHVVLASTTACSLISTNKFVPDTNYSFTVSSAAAYTNERQQSPHHQGLFVSTNSDRCGGRSEKKTMDPLQAAGLKVASSKKGEGGVKMRTEARSSGGNVFLS